MAYTPHTYSDIAQQLADYRGVLGWNALTTAYGDTVPAIEIPLYLKEHTIPMRKPKITEISTVQMLDPEGFDMATNVIFEGAPDILQIDLSGFIITPIDGAGHWAPVDKTGAALNWGQVSYADIITYMIEGRFNRSLLGAWMRRDPAYYISPYGSKYNTPVIADFQPSYTPVQKKQSFTMTLWLEK